MAVERKKTLEERRRASAEGEIRRRERAAEEDARRDAARQEGRDELDGHIDTLHLINADIAGPDDIRVIRDALQYLLEKRRDEHYE